MTAGAAGLLVLDSISEAVGRGNGAIAVTGSHGGRSAARFAIEAGVRIAVFNDAGIGKDGAGIAALDMLERHAIAACTVGHLTARIGEAASTLQDGVISHANPSAVALGARPGLGVRDWLAALPG